MAAERRPNGGNDTPFTPIQRTPLVGRNDPFEQAMSQGARRPLAIRRGPRYDPGGLYLRVGFGWVPSATLLDRHPDPVIDEEHLDVTTLHVVVRRLSDHDVGKHPRSPRRGPCCAHGAKRVGHLGRFVPTNAH